MAQSIVGTALATNWHALYARPSVAVYCDWNMDGDYADASENITAYVSAVHGEHRLYDPLVGLPMLGGTKTSTATVVCENSSDFFSPDNAAGLAGTYTAVANGYYRVPIIIDMGYLTSGGSPEVLRQFTGVIEGYNDSETANARQITFECKGLDRMLSQYKLTTTAQAGKRIDEVISGHLTTAGVGSPSVDRSVSIIDWEWLDDANLLEHLRELAAADGGWFYYGKDGTARYEHAPHWLEGADHTTAVTTLDEAGTLRFDDTLRWANLYKSVVVEYSPVSGGPADVLYRAAKTLVVPPGSAITEKCRFMRIAESASVPVAGTDYDACSAGGTDLSANLTVTMTAYAEQADVTLTNANATHAIHVYGLQVRGYPLVIDEAQEVRSTSALSVIDGEKEWALRGNRWIQTREQAARLAGRLRDLLQYPRRLWVWRGPLCPYLELGDRVTMDNTAKGIAADGYVVGFSFGYRVDDLLRMKVDVLPVANVFGAAAYFILGTSNYSATSAPVYY